MTKCRGSEEQLIGILREGRAQHAGEDRVLAEHNISGAIYYAWKCKYGGMDVSEAR